MANIHSTGHIIASRYKILSFIGEGGMQEVYLALDTAFGRNVALKAPKNTHASKRFQRSAEASAKVTHPNVAKTLDYIPEGGHFYLIEEFIPGTDLQKRLLSDFHYLDPHLAAHLIHHVAKGLAACHHVGVFHRDLKPSNIMVSEDPGLSNVKLTDFGIAKIVEDEIDQVLAHPSESTVAGSTTVVGAIPYMAPELIFTPKQATIAADIWSLGALLYYVLTGHHPYGSTFVQVIQNVRSPLPKRDLRLQTPQFKSQLEQLWQIVQRCMSQDPAGRPTATEAAQILSEVCYSTAPRRLGTVKGWKLKGFDWGFIVQDGGPDAFFHRDSFYGTEPKNGLRVNFAAFEGEPNPRAFPVLPVKR